MATTIIGKVGLTPKGEFLTGTSYEKLDVVMYEGNGYISNINNNTDFPGTSANWKILASKGEKFKYEDFTPEELEGLRGEKGDPADEPIPLRIADPTPTVEGTYRPIEEGTYSNGLTFDASEGQTFFILQNSQWSKQEFPITFTPIGEVVEGDENAVSGDKIRKAINAEVYKSSTPVLEVGAINFTNGENAPSTTRARTVSSQITNGVITLTSPSLFMTNIVYYTNGAFHSVVTLGFVKTYTIAFPSGADSYRVVLAKNPNTGTVSQSDIVASTMSINSPDKYDFSFIDQIKPMKSDYDSAQIDVNTSTNELGGIGTGNGENAKNNVRIRSKSKNIVSPNVRYTITNVTSGYVLSRIFKYLNGSFVGYVSYPPNTFTPDSTYNEIRLVWEKTINTTPITPEEVNSFSFNIFSTSTQKLSDIAKRVSVIPQLESRVQALENNNNTYWLGKKMVSMGDSITYGFIPRNSPGYPGQLDSWAKLTAEALGMSFVNLGISGSTLGQVSPTDAVSRQPMIHRTNAIPSDADLITVMGGTNDLRNIAVMGNPESTNPWEFNGALNILFTKLLEAHVYSNINNPKTIVAVTPIQIYPNDSFGANNLTIKDYRDAMIERAKRYNIPVFDAWALSGLTPELFRTVQGTEAGYTDMYNPYLTDGVHPTDEGHRLRFMPSFAGFLKTIK